MVRPLTCVKKINEYYSCVIDQRILDTFSAYSGLIKNQEFEVEDQLGFLFFFFRNSINHKESR